jgi:flagellar assembly protein FliH
MSSRLLRPGVPCDAIPIAWRQADGLAVQPRQAIADNDPSTPSAEIQAQTNALTQAAYQQGLAAGEAVASQRLTPVTDSLNIIIQELAGLRKRFRMEAEEDTARLAIAIARRVLHRELSTDPEAILGLVMAAFQKLNARETHCLRVSPADVAALQENRGRLEFPAALEVTPDASLTTGSVIFETSRGELDASVDTQLSEIERGFADLIRRRPK